MVLPPLHLCISCRQLKARLAKLRTQLLEPGGGGGAESAGFEVSKSGDARVSLIGKKTRVRSAHIIGRSIRHYRAIYEYLVEPCSHFPAGLLILQVFLRSVNRRF